MTKNDQNDKKKKDFKPTKNDQNHQKWSKWPKKDQNHKKGLNKFLGQKYIRFGTLCLSSESLRM